MNNLNNVTKDWTHADQFLNDKIDKNNNSIKHDFGELTNHVNTSLESVENEVKMLNGVAEGQFITDSAAKMVKVVPDGVNKGVVSMVGGKTQKMVQAMDVLNGENVSAYDASRTTITISDGITTVSYKTSGYGYGYGAKIRVTEFIPANHVAFIKAYIMPSEATTFAYDIKELHSTTDCPKNVYTLVTDYVTINESISMVVTSPRTTQQSGFNYKIKDLQIFDLTVMFGAGKEPTKQKCDEIFGNMEYVPYTDGDLWSAPVKKVVSLGVNMCSPFIFGIGLNASTGEEYVSTTTCTTDFIPIDVSKSYYINNLANTLYSFIAWYDSNGNYIDRTSGTARSNISLSSNEFGKNARFIRITQYESTGVTGKISDMVGKKVMMNVGTTALPYTPYNKTTLSLEKIVDKLPDYGISVDDEYNYIDFENMVYHHRVASADLSSLTWYMLENNLFFTSPIGVVTDSQYGVECSKYNKSMALSIRDTENGCIGHGRPVAASGGGSFVVRDSKYNTVSDFQNNLNEAIATYKITEELIPLTDLLLPFKCEPGGTVTFENEHNLDVPNSVIYEKEMK